MQQDDADAYAHEANGRHHAGKAMDDAAHDDYGRDPVSPAPAWHVALVAGAAAAAVLFVLLRVTFHGNVLCFYRIGDYLPPAPALAGRDVCLFRHQAGYDGQYYLALALDPALRDPGTLAALDNPQYRCRRILFPLLGRTLGLGQPDLIPWALPLLNVALVVALVWLVAHWLQLGGRNGWGGLLVLSILGVWEVLALTTTDLLSSVLLVAALLALRTQRYPAAALAMALAALTREVTLLYWVMLLGAMVAARQWRSLRWLLWAGLPAAAWNLYLLRHVPTGPGGIVVHPPWGLPGAGWLASIGVPAGGGWEGEKSLFAALVLLSFLAVLVALLSNLWRLRAARAAWPTTVVAFPLTVMFLFARFSYFLDYGRVFQDLFLLLILTLGFAAVLRRLAGVALGLAAVTSVAFALHHIFGVV
jgi:hypothetical protein